MHPRRTPLANQIPNEGGWPVHRKFYDAQFDDGESDNNHLRIPPRPLRGLVESAREIIDYGTNRGAAFRDESFQRGREFAVATTRDTVNAGADALDQRVVTATGLSPFALCIGAVLFAALAMVVRVHFVVRLN